MKNKKYLGLFFDFTIKENFNQFLIANEFMLNKFVEVFGKIYIINLVEFAKKQTWRGTITPISRTIQTNYIVHRIGYHPNTTPNTTVLKHSFHNNPSTKISNLIE